MRRFRKVLGDYTTHDYIEIRQAYDRAVDKGLKLLTAEEKRAVMLQDFVSSTNVKAGTELHRGMRWSMTNSDEAKMFNNFIGGAKKNKRFDINTFSSFSQSKNVTSDFNGIKNMLRAGKEGKDISFYRGANITLKSDGKLLGMDVTKFSSISLEEAETIVSAGQSFAVESVKKTALKGGGEFYDIVIKTSIRKFISKAVTTKFDVAIRNIFDQPLSVMRERLIKK